MNTRSPWCRRPRLRRAAAVCRKGAAWWGSSSATTTLAPAPAASASLRHTPSMCSPSSTCVKSLNGVRLAYSVSFQFQSSVFPSNCVMGLNCVALVYSRESIGFNSSSVCVRGLTDRILSCPRDSVKINPLFSFNLCEGIQTMLLQHVHILISRLVFLLFSSYRSRSSLWDKNTKKTKPPSVISSSTADFLSTVNE